MDIYRTQTVASGAMDPQRFLLNLNGICATPNAGKESSVRGASFEGGAADVESSSAGTPSAEVFIPRCAGLEFARMKKEEARDRYKEQRRAELQRQGDYERVKRRRKNDVSMSDHQKYTRRLKMNQDSAAAARNAQDVYVQTLEQLVETGEAEKSLLLREMSAVRADRDALARRVTSLQQELPRRTPDFIDGVSMPVAHGETFQALLAHDLRFTLDEPQFGIEQSFTGESQQDPILARKMAEISEFAETAPASSYDVGTFVMPARAV
jgi:hypothetical protein